VGSSLRRAAEPAAPGSIGERPSGKPETAAPLVAATGGARRTQPAASAAAAANVLTIELAPSGDCWAQLTTDGAVVLSRVLKAGERETRAFHDSAVLQVGDAAACVVLINGRQTRPLGPPKKVREVRITPTNYTAFLP
jgi:hypothetical protein